MTDTTTITINPPTFRATVGILQVLTEAGTAEAKATAWEEIGRWAAMLDNFAAAERRAAEPDPDADKKAMFRVAALEAWGMDDVTVTNSAEVELVDGGAWVDARLFITNAEAGLA